MILTGLEIEKRLGTDIIIDPFNPSQLNPNSYNLRLGNDLLIYDVNRHQSIYKDPECDSKWKLEDEQSCIFYPGSVILAETLEHTFTNNLVPMLEGRSSLARQFCMIHVSAGFGDIGFTGKWTLEIVPFVPITLKQGMEICQIYYHTIEGDYLPYNGRYNNNNGVQPVINGGE